MCVSCRDPINTVMLTRAGYSALYCRSVNHIDTFTSKQTDSASGQSDTLSPLLSSPLSSVGTVSPYQMFTALHCCSAERKTQNHAGITKELHIKQDVHCR